LTYAQKQQIMTYILSCMHTTATEIPSMKTKVNVTKKGSSLVTGYCFG
jgi:hypothetical protein